MITAAEYALLKMTPATAPHYDRYRLLAGMLREEQGPAGAPLVSSTEFINMIYPRLMDQPANEITLFYKWVRIAAKNHVIAAGHTNEPATKGFLKGKPVTRYLWRKPGAGQVSVNQFL